MDIKLIWIDPRVWFYNLNSVESSNVLSNEERRSIWVPTISLVNTASKVFCFILLDLVFFFYPQDFTISDNRSEILVQKRGQHTISTDIEAKNNFLYEGKENLLKISRGYVANWICDFDMNFYPFDTQVKKVFLKDKNERFFFLNRNVRWSLLSKSL